MQLPHLQSRISAIPVFWLLLEMWLPFKMLQVVPLFGSGISGVRCRFLSSFFPEFILSQIKLLYFPLSLGPLRINLSIFKQYFMLFQCVSYVPLLQFFHYNQNITNIFAWKLFLHWNLCYNPPYLRAHYGWLGLSSC